MSGRTSECRVLDCEKRSERRKVLKYQRVIPREGYVRGYCLLLRVLNTGLTTEFSVLPGVYTKETVGYVRLYLTRLL